MKKRVLIVTLLLLLFASVYAQKVHFVTYNIPGLVESPTKGVNYN